MAKHNWISELKRTDSPLFELAGVYRLKGQTYKVEVSFSSRGLRCKGTQTHIWRVSDDPTENNENGVIPGVRGFQGPYSENALRKLINRVTWEN